MMRDEKDRDQEPRREDVDEGPPRREDEWDEARDEEDEGQAGTSEPGEGIGKHQGGGIPDAIGGGQSGQGGG